MGSVLVDSIESIRQMVEDIETSPLEHPFLFVDLEGTDLSRHGKIAIMQVLVPPKREVYLIDVQELQWDAFQTASINGLTFRTILESAVYPKVFFDVRNDSDALYAHFNIELACVVDVQLFEFATRPYRGRFLKGLAKSISEDSSLGWSERRQWQEIKDAGAKLFAPEKGGSYEVFHERPIPAAIINYCVQDVLILPELLKKYSGRLGDDFAVQVHKETLARVELSQSASFSGKGRHMAAGPYFSWTRVSNEPLCFPMTLIQSRELDQYCTLATAAETRQIELPQRVSNASADGAIALESPTQSPAPDVTARLARMSMGGSLGLDRASGPDKSEEDDDDCDPELSYEEEGWLSSASSRSGSPTDYTACSAEDCGYCGRCQY